MAKGRLLYIHHLRTEVSLKGAEFGWGGEEAGQSEARDGAMAVE